MAGQLKNRVRSFLPRSNRAENPNMGWNADRTSVGDKWGDGPATLETPSATLDLKTLATRAGVWRLDATGKRAGQIPATLEKGHLRFTVSPDDQSPWYEVALAPIKANGVIVR